MRRVVLEEGTCGVQTEGRAVARDTERMIAVARRGDLNGAQAVLNSIDRSLGVLRAAHQRP